MNNFDKNIVKLTHNNYGEWRMSFRGVLMFYDLIGQLDPLNSRPNSPDDAMTPEEKAIRRAEIAEWDKRDRKANGIMVNSLTSSQYPLFSEKSTALQNYEDIKRHHFGESSANQDVLLKQLENLKQAAPIKEHILAFEQHLENYLNVGGQVDELKKCRLLKSSLSRDWDEYKKTIDTSETVMIPDGTWVRNPITLTYLKHKLISIEIDNASVNKPSTSFANVTRGQNRKPKGKGLFCSNCNKANHSKEKCFSPGGGREGQAPSWWKIKASPETRNPQKGGKPNGKSQGWESDVSLIVSDLGLSMGSLKKEDIILDSGCTTSTFNNLVYFDTIDFSTANQPTQTFSGSANVSGQGTARIPMGKFDIVIPSALYCPSGQVSLISEIQLDELGYKVTKPATNKRVVHDKDSNSFITVTLEDRLLKIRPEPYAFFNRTITPIDANLAHQRLGHCDTKHLHRAISQNHLKGISIIGSFHTNECESCLIGKIQALPHRLQQKPEIPGELVGVDYKGPVEKHSVIEGYNGFIIFRDYYTSYTKIYGVTKKSEALNAIRDFVNWFESETSHKVKAFRTDRGTEWLNNEVMTLLNKAKIKLQPTAGYSAASNGMAEQGIKVIMQRAKTMRVQSGLSKGFWWFCVRHSAYTYNMTPKPDGISPHEKLFGKAPNVNHLRVFGCLAVRLIPKKLRSPLDPPGEKGIFVGFPKNGDGFLIWHGHGTKISRDVKFIENVFPAIKENNETDELAQDDMVSWSVFDMLEDELSEVITPVVIPREMPPMVHSTTPTGAESQTTDTPNPPSTPTATRTISSEHSSSTNFSPSSASLIPSTPTSEGNVEIANHSETNEVSQDGQPSAAIRKLQSDLGPAFTLQPDQTRQSRAQRVAKSSNALAHSTGEMPNATDFDDSVNTTNELQEAISYSLMFSDHLEAPLTYNEAMGSTVSHKWRESIDKELSSLKENGTWSVVKRPNDQKIISSKWVFTIKPDGRYKSRLTARGDQQPNSGLGVFSATIRSETLVFLFALQVHYGLSARIVDFVTAYLNSHLKSPVFMHFPQGWGGMTDKANCLRLEKCIYGLRESGKLWNEDISRLLADLGFERCMAEWSLYKATIEKEMVVVGLFVDDMIILAKSNKVIDHVVNQLQAKFKLRDLGTPTKLLGLEIEKKGKSLAISQEALIEKLASSFHHDMSLSKPVSTPMEPGFVSSLDESVEIIPQIQQYQSLVGSLLYISRHSRPDICLSVAILTQFMNTAQPKHWSAAKRVLRYLYHTRQAKRTLTTMKKDQLMAYCDASWAADKDDRRSRSGGVIFFNGILLHAWSRKQKTVALSTAEAEYYSMSTAIQNLLFFKILLNFLGLLKDKPMVLNVDCRGAIDLGQSTKNHDRTKHIDLRHHFIRELVMSHKLVIQYVPTEEQVADALTKAVTAPKLKRLQNALNIVL